MKKILKFLAVVVLCGFSTPAFSAMTLGGNYVSTDSKCFMDMLITETGVLQGTRSEFLKVTIKGSANFRKCSLAPLASQSLYIFGFPHPGMMGYIPLTRLPIKFALAIWASNLCIISL